MSFKDLLNPRDLLKLFRLFYNIIVNIYIHPANISTSMDFFFCLSCMYEFMFKYIIYLLYQEEAYSNAFFTILIIWFGSPECHKTPFTGTMSHFQRSAKPILKARNFFFSESLDFLSHLNSHIPWNVFEPICLDPLTAVHTHIPNPPGINVKMYLLQWDIKVLTGGMSQFHC